jgi:large subunit ribosomal protein L6
MIEGVAKGYEKKLELRGVGYRADLKGEDLILKVGFSHLVLIKKVEGVKFSVEKNIITVFGIDKEIVGQIAAKIRKVRPPEPYKGKGIRYLGEEVKRKTGKKTVGSEGS